MMLALRVSGIVAVLALAGCSTPSTPSATTHSTTGPLTSVPSPTLAPSPTLEPSASSSPSPPRAGLTTASVRPESVTFIAPGVGWVLGLSLCHGSPCLRLAKTVDAGRSWGWLSGGNLSGLSTVIPWHLRFADSQDGWISGPALYATHNAGRTWTRIVFPGFEGSIGSVEALEAADGRVYAEIAEGFDLNTLGPVVLFVSPTNVDSWHPVSGVTTGPAGYSGDISLAQGVFWAMLHPAIVTAQGNQALSALYRSRDGVTWRREPQPCPSDTVAGVAAATSARVFVVCGGGVALGSQLKSAYRSDNGGASYERVADPPFSGDLEAVAASRTSVSVAVASGGTSLYASFDDGRTWTTTLGFGDGGLGLSELGFTTAMLGVVIHGQIASPESLQLLMTSDGGHEWNPVAVVPP
jgi:photosystem II stability/assembly factor-like uncharacterized protein